MSDSPLTQRAALRRTMRARRRSLSRAQQNEASAALLRLLKRQPLFQRARRIALYWPADGEINPYPLLDEARRRGKRCYLPALDPLHRATLEFRPYRPGDVLVPNRYGIPEAQSKPVSPHSLDLVLVPLVAFDRYGNRLGMGGGYYDRSFAFKQRNPAAKPFLLGLAHRCQATGELPCESWDVPLQAIMTDAEVLVGGPSYRRDFRAGDFELPEAAD